MVMAGPLASCSAAARKAASTSACSLVLARPRQYGMRGMEGGRNNIYIYIIYIVYNISKGSMGLAYLPTWMDNFFGNKCR